MSSIDDPDLRQPLPDRPGNQWLLLLLCGLVLFLLGMVVRGWLNETSTPPFEPRVVAARGDLAEDEQTTISIFQNASPSVVFITTLSVERRGLSFNPRKVPTGTGSGFIWDKQGHIVTNYHVLQNANEAVVTLEDQSSWEASLVGWEPDKDLAVLKINAPADRLVPIQIGESHNLQVGQKVFAIGNPFGFDYTLTAGVISGLGREIESTSNRPIQGVIQTDCAINPGNSGGPLLDSAGRMIGVNTQIYSPSGGSDGIGFAVPVAEVKRLVPDLIKYGKSNRPNLGIEWADYSVKRWLGVQKGVVVTRVHRGGGAEAAGIRPAYINRQRQAILGDVIIGIDDAVIKDADDLYRALDGRNPNERVKVTLKRGRRGPVEQVMVELKRDKE